MRISELSTAQLAHSAEQANIVVEYTEGFRSSSPSPDDPPKEMDVLNIVPSRGYPYPVRVITTRVILIGYGVGEGRSGLGWYYVGAVNSKEYVWAESTLPGGKLDPREIDPTSEGNTVDALESPRACACRETFEEVGIVIDESELLLFGLRYITEKGSGAVKRTLDLPSVDAYFLAVHNLQLYASEGYKNETGSRLLLPFRQCTRSVQEGARFEIPQTQAIGLAKSVVFVNDILGDAAPASLPRDALDMMRRDAEGARAYVAQSKFNRHFMLLLQQSPWLD